MYQNIFDTHAHYDDERFDGDREALLDGLKALNTFFQLKAEELIQQDRTDNPTGKQALRG